MCQTLISRSTREFPKIFAAFVMCSIFVFLWQPSMDIRRQHDKSFLSYDFNLHEYWNPPSPRWTPVQNKSEYVGEMANATLRFTKLDSPEVKELLDMNVNCSQLWITTPRAGFLGSNVMQAFFAYSLKFKYKVQVGMVEDTWNMVHEVFPYIHLQLLPPECLAQLEKEEKMKLVFDKNLPRELAEENKRFIIVHPTRRPVVDFWYLRKVLIEEFRIADHFVAEAKIILGNLLDKWRRQMSSTKSQLTQPTAVVGVHVRRRRDKAGELKRRLNTTLPPAAYYNLAFASARKMFGAVAFVVITDNLKWSHQYLLTAHLDAVIQGKIISRGVDMAILSMCDHIIYGVGNFGFLGAWLAGGKIFYPDGIYTGGERPAYVQREKELTTYHHFIPIQYNHTEDFF